MLPARIEEKIAYEPMSGCWLWTAALDGKGYGVAWWRGQTRKAHIVTYEILVGDVPPGLQRDHLCRNRACCNPWHIDVVTAAENSRRGDVGLHNKRKTHCPQGHSYDEFGVSIPSRPTARYCGECKRIDNAEKCRRYAARRRAKRIG